MSVTDALDRLLDQDPERVRQYAESRFDTLAHPRAPLVLFGAGGLGRKVVETLRGRDVPIVALADNDCALHGKDVGGFSVMSPQAAADRFGADATFVVTVFVNSDVVVQQLRALGCRTVLSYYPLFWKYPALLPHYVFDLPHKVIAAAPDVKAGYTLMSDDASRAEYIAHVAWRLDPTSPLPPVADHTIYFPDFFALVPNELFVDCGGFDGDSLHAFLRRAPEPVGGVVVFEPDPANVARLEASIRTLKAAPRIEVHRAAVGFRTTTLRIDARATASTVRDDGELTVPCARIDEVLGARRATYIKMDVEGAEPDAIMGAAAQIRTHAPLLALSAYHSQDHLWRLPLMVHALRPDYRYYLRHYATEGVDALVVYAVPPGRT